MAFDKSNLHIVTYAGPGANIYRYTTTGDNKVAVNGSGYFNGAVDQLNVGDRLMITASDGAVDREVTSNNGTTVDTGAVT